MQSVNEKQRKTNPGAAPSECVCVWGGVTDKDGCVDDTSFPSNEHGGWQEWMLLKRRQKQGAHRGAPRGSAAIRR